ncbi:hypothetical protein DPEC_G00065430 [Dallia pectoralis]|uniref:Uncharacterized protein n=1 Tax=Dallia pectoralis TaxID=75939 RepID=A0ACC2H8X6_DALPE|nr:hypothetical protein DPEC_G00065430 [Dallia pectoralis]
MQSAPGRYGGPEKTTSGSTVDVLTEARNNSHYCTQRKKKEGTDSRTTADTYQPIHNSSGKYLSDLVSPQQPHGLHTIGRRAFISSG